jgi:hypothetical protein
VPGPTQLQTVPPAHDDARWRRRRHPRSRSRTQETAKTRSTDRHLPRRSERRPILWIAYVSGSASQRSNDSPASSIHSRFIWMKRKRRDPCSAGSPRAAGTRRRSRCGFSSAASGSAAASWAPGWTCSVSQTPCGRVTRSASSVRCWRFVPRRRIPIAGWPRFERPR